MKIKLKMLLQAVVLCILTFLLMMIYIPQMMGYEMFYIQTDSMTPTLSKGSLVFCKEIAFEDIRVNDILTFRNDFGNDFFTHRVVAIDEDNQMLTTKGDANEENDPSPTSYYFAIGKVDFSIPAVGRVVMFMHSAAGIALIAAFYIAWVAVEIELFVMKRKAKAGGLQ